MRGRGPHHPIDYEKEIWDEWMCPPGGDDVWQRGIKAFKKHCHQCHSIYPDGHVSSAGRSDWGPTLWNICGRQAGILKGKVGEGQIRCSDYLQDLGKNGLVWNDANLMRYMRDPRPFTDVGDSQIMMRFQGIPDMGTRIDILTYLHSLRPFDPYGEGVMHNLKDRKSWKGVTLLGHLPMA
ncbi:unnamed protein product [Vitrella brassicaformis CCMP3155]|uniref:Cytochrome c domain-containing protein n=2 Tax=Vitrella brassicaformis TaxID=1169539 RepID=A0A0G4GUN9_VITBC|nr:unnamed protein product [Vitrella brassicaformis CCMP3155]|mmetsp:Transcript_6165/g.14827  ORF Transcript_6165/g.14827 Transcript_6165/m.14827 type:complete len:180 (+) Transcript_6165:226-765(+)|eukprot:CEM34495.1 unnamed protein product [Vitrella brassicaformis CCMP3155]